MHVVRRRREPSGATDRVDGRVVGEDVETLAYTG